MNLQIREASEADAAALRDYAERLFSEDLPGIFRRPVPTLEEEAAFIRTRIAPANGTLLVAWADSAPVGLADLVPSTLAEEAHAATFGISVDRDWRGRGVGSALLDALAEWAGAHGVSRIQGYVWQNNPRATELYLRHGFEREGVCRRAVIRDGIAIDVTLVARLLDA